MSRLNEMLRIRMRRLSEATSVYSLARRGGRGSIPTFIEGLIESSTLIEEIKQDLSPKYTVKWGQIVSSNDEFSKEIDAIIFEGKPYYECQNIGYALIPKEHVKAVIEVNSWLGSGVSSLDEYKQLCKQLKTFSPKAYLFCYHIVVKRDKTVEQNRNRLKGYGFDDVFFLKKQHNNEISFIEEDWFRFVQTIRNL